MVVGQGRACFVLSYGCRANRSMFHVRLLLWGKQECVSCLVVVVGQARVCFTLNCGCRAGRSMFHVKLWL